MSTSKSLRIFGFALAVAVAASTVTQRAQAQEVTAHQLDSVGKGTIGLGLIGAELGLAIPALIGVDEIWPYIVFPVVGAAGGAVGGYFAIDANNEQEAGIAMVATAFALVVPTVVLTVSALKYDPEREDGVVPENEATISISPEDESVDPLDQGSAPSSPPAGAPLPPSTDAPSDASSSETAPQSSRRVRRAPLAASLRGAGTGFLRLSPLGLELGFPGVRTVPTYSLEEMRQMGLSMREQRAEVRIELFSASF